MQVDSEMNILRGERDQAKDIIDDLQGKLTAVNAVLADYDAERQVCVLTAALSRCKDTVVMCVRGCTVIRILFCGCPACVVVNRQSIMVLAAAGIGSSHWCNHVPAAVRLKASSCSLTMGVAAACLQPRLQANVSIGQVC